MALMSSNNSSCPSPCARQKKISFDDLIFKIMHFVQVDFFFLFQTIFLWLHLRIYFLPIIFLIIIVSWLQIISAKIKIIVTFHLDESTVLIKCLSPKTENLAKTLVMSSIIIKTSPDLMWLGQLTFPRCSSSTPNHLPACFLKGNCSVLQKYK